MSAWGKGRESAREELIESGQWFTTLMEGCSGCFFFLLLAIALAIWVVYAVM